MLCILCECCVFMHSLWRCDLIRLLKDIVMILKVSKTEVWGNKVAWRRSHAGWKWSQVHGCPTSKRPLEPLPDWAYNPDSDQFMQMQKKFLCDYVWQRVSVNAWKPGSRQPEWHPQRVYVKPCTRTSWTNQKPNIQSQFGNRLSQQHKAIPMGINAMAKWYS